jgi:hypothetical protein
MLPDELLPGSFRYKTPASTSECSIQALLKVCVVSIGPNPYVFFLSPEVGRPLSATSSGDGVHLHAWILDVARPKSYPTRAAVLAT